MHKNRGIAIIGISIVAGMSAAVVADDDTDRALLERAQQLFKPLPSDAGTAEYPVTPERVALGKALFFEPRVSVRLPTVTRITLPRRRGCAQSPVIARCSKRPFQAKPSR
jgi:hypothetical protein